jgi:hypothetical protein
MQTRRSRLHCVSVSGHWFRIVRVTVVLAMVALLAACQGEAEPPDAHPELVDPEGLVAQHEFLLPARDDDVLPHLDRPVDDQAVVIDGPDGVDVRVVWTALPCQVAPRVEVSRELNNLVVTVDRGPQVLGPGEECPSMEDFFGVDLVLASETDIDHVEARIR